MTDSTKSEKKLINKVDMLILMETDIAKAVEFYQKLGLKLVFHLKEKWAEMRLGDIKFGLCPSPEAKEGHTGIVLEVGDMDATFKALQKEGIEFLNEPIEATHGIMVSLKDPSGNILDLYQPTPEKVADLMKKTAKEGESDNKDCCGKSSCAKASADRDQCCKTGIA